MSGERERAREMSNVTCPFCGETDFDALGLKHHFLRGWCDVFEAVESDEERRAADRAPGREGEGENG